MTNNGFLDFQRVREALDFLAVLSHYGIAFDATREQLKIACPFHDDRTPSCGVNTIKKAFNCFGCGQSGNVLEFVALMEGGDPKEIAGLKLGAETAITIMSLNRADYLKATSRPQKAQNAPVRAKKPAKATKPAQSPKQPVAVNSGRPETSQPTNSAPPTGGTRNPVLSISLELDPAHPFFDAHGIVPEMVETFGLGHCRKGIMRDRICIPIHNEAGELVAYAGRYPSEDVPDGVERYRLPKNFHKAQVLFNLHRAKELGGRHLTIVEGFWSVMRLHLAGIPAVAAIGTSISVEQAELVHAAGFRFATVIFDGDQGGRDGAARSLPILARKVYARLIDLPDGVKPDTMSEEILTSLRPQNQ